MTRFQQVLFLVALFFTQTLALPQAEAWYHESDHPVHALFPRAPIEVGTAAWLAAFPATREELVPRMPQAWKDKLQQAKSAGKIPNVPVSVLATVEGVPAYPQGMDSAGPVICSSTAQCRNTALGDIYEVPANVYATGFDDGPAEATLPLINFLKSKNEKATHFVQGTNIRTFTEQWKAILGSGHDIAVHTFSHPHMTTLSDEEVVAQLGWTIEIIKISGGKVPKFWRPPYGDSDNRVRAIAMEVFGLRSIMWTQDTKDYLLRDGGAAARQALDGEFKQWLTGPKNPGLNILEHESSPQSVQAFIETYPLMKSNGWQLVSAVAAVANIPIPPPGTTTTKPTLTPTPTPTPTSGLPISPSPTATGSPLTTTTPSSPTGTTAGSESGTTSTTAGSGNNGAARPSSSILSIFVLVASIAFFL